MKKYYPVISIYALLVIATLLLYCRVYNKWPMKQYLGVGSCYYYSFHPEKNGITTPVIDKYGKNINWPWSYYYKVVNENESETHIQIAQDSLSTAFTNMKRNSMFLLRYSICVPCEQIKQ